MYNIVTWWASGRGCRCSLGRRLRTLLALLLALHQGGLSMYAVKVQSRTCLPAAVLWYEAAARRMIVTLMASGRGCRCSLGRRLRTLLMLLLALHQGGLSMCVVMAQSHSGLMTAVVRGI
jgi:CO dehydrogenase nickel-insertion accessory protein CooC1